MDVAPRWAPRRSASGARDRGDRDRGDRDDGVRPSRGASSAAVSGPLSLEWRRGLLDSSGCTSLWVEPDEWVDEPAGDSVLVRVLGT